MELERNTIERTDFSTARRGYDSAEVDAHLREVAEAVKQLRDRVDELSARPESLSEAANERLRRILEAAEASAAEVRSEAGEEARGLIEDAQREARTMTEEAERRARERDTESESTSAERLSRVDQRTAELMRRADALDGEFDRLLERMRAAATAAVETLREDVSTVRDELEDLPGETPPGARAAAAGPAGAGGLDDLEPDEDRSTTVVEPIPAAEPLGDEVIPEPRRGEALPEETWRGSRVAPEDSSEEPPTVAEEQRAETPDDDEAPAVAPVSGDDHDVEGARLIALNMALSGSSRAETADYLRETFGLEDRALLDDVYDRVQAG